VLPQRKRTNRVATLDLAEGHVRRPRLTASTPGLFLSPEGSYGFGYFYYFAEVWPALLFAESG
jgi:hypothetical protein